MKTYRLIIPALFTIILLVACNQGQETDNSQTPTSNPLIEAEGLAQPDSDTESDAEATPEQAECRNLRTLKMLMDKYRSATEAMRNNGDGLDYTRVGSISSTIKMNIQSFERAGSQSMSPECWDEYQQIKSDFEIMCLTNQAQDLEEMDVDLDNVVD